MYNDTCNDTCTAACVAAAYGGHAHNQRLQPVAVCLARSQRLDLSVSLHYALLHTRPYTRVYAHVHMRAHTCVDTHVSAHLYTRVHTHVRAHLYTIVHTHVRPPIDDCAGSPCSNILVMAY